MHGFARTTIRNFLRDLSALVCREIRPGDSMSPANGEPHVHRKSA